MITNSTTVKRLNKSACSYS